MVPWHNLCIHGLLVCITLLYIVFVDNGLSSAVMGGLILSLVPLFTVIVIGLVVNQKYFRTTTSNDSTMEQQEIQHNTMSQIDGDEELETSQQPLLMRRSQL